MPIDATTWKELFEAVYEINSAPSHADFGESVVAGMSRLIRTELAVFQVLDRATGRIMTRMAPQDPSTSEKVLYYSSHSEEMPSSPTSPAPRTGGLGG